MVSQVVCETGLDGAGSGTGDPPANVGSGGPAGVPELPPQATEARQSGVKSGKIHIGVLVRRALPHERHPAQSQLGPKFVHEGPWDRSMGPCDLSEPTARRASITERAMHGLGSGVGFHDIARRL